MYLGISVLRPPYHVVPGGAFQASHALGEEQYFEIQSLKPCLFFIRTCNIDWVLIRFMKL